MKYSIIIPTYDRLPETLGCIWSLEEMEFPIERFEVIVVDDGSIDKVEDFLHRNIQNFSFYSQDNKGQGAARNLGMEKAKGDFFIFIDSDVTVPKDWLSIIDRELGNADAFGGPDACKDSDPPLAKAINYSMTSLTGGMRGKA